MHCSEAEVKEGKLVISTEWLYFFFCCLLLIIDSDSVHYLFFSANNFLLLYFSLKYGLNILQGIQSENKSTKKSLKVCICFLLVECFFVFVFKLRLALDLTS